MTHNIRMGFVVFGPALVAFCAIPRPEIGCSASTRRAQFVNYLCLVVDFM